MSFPFHYSTLNYDLSQSTPSGSLNILWNQLGEKMKADSIMFMTPNFDPTIGFTYPEFGIWGNNLLNPMLAIQQTMQAFQNGTWMNGAGGIGGGNWFNNMPWGNWNNPWGGNNGGSTTDNPEYDALKAVLNKYKELNPNDTNANKVIKEALNKSGTADEKFQALKDAYKKLNKTKLEKALLDLPDYKKMLDPAGYNFNGMNKEEDKKLRADLEKLASRIKDKSCEYGGFINPTSDDILRIVSYWNDTHSTSENRGIIRLIANNFPTEESVQTKHKELVENLAQALVYRAADLKSELEGSFPKLDKAKNDVSDALATVNKDKGFTKDNIIKLAEKFDTLYAMLRMMEAEKIKNTITAKYSFLNNISSTDVDFVNDDLVVKSTKEDLKKEGITSIPETDKVPKEEIDASHDADDYSDYESADEKIEKLVEKEHLVKTAKEGVYKTKTASTTGEATKYYTVKDDKLVELVDVKDIDKDGNCTMTDGSKKPVSGVTAKEVSAEDIDQYNQTIKRIESLKGSKIEKCAVQSVPAGTVLYKSKGNDEEGNRQYFVIRDNKLMKINGICYTDGSVKINGVKKQWKDLAESDFTEISDSEIITEDLKAKKAQEEADAAKEKQEKEEKEKEEADAVKIPTINEKSTGYKNGQEVYNKLSGSTNDDEWTIAKNNILGSPDGTTKAVSKDTIRDFVAGYVDARGGWHIGDNLLEQIATEYDNTGFFGWGSTYRSGRKELINHIVKTVLEYCEAHPQLMERDAYTKLKEKYADGNGITADDINNRSSDKYNDDGSVAGIRGLDHLILELLDINI